MKVFVTKYALTQGITEAEVDRSPLHPDMVCSSATKTWDRSYYHGEGKEWHQTRSAAVEQAEKLRLNKIRLLKQRIKQLETMEFK
jgi:hypothetical protein